MSNDPIVLEAVFWLSILLTTPFLWKVASIFFEIIWDRLIPYKVAIKVVHDGGTYISEVKVSDSESIVKALLRGRKKGDGNC